MGYRLKRDIVIPAGTDLGLAPQRTDRFDRNGSPAILTGLPPHFVEAVVGPTNDTVFTWTMHIGDALEADLIEAVE